MKIAVIGSRSFDDFPLLRKTLNGMPEVSTIVSGGAKGADLLGINYAICNNIPTIIFYPNWALHKRGAGHRRNEFIIRESDLILAFWDGRSKGTFNTIELAKKIGKPIKVIQFRI